MHHTRKTAGRDSGKAPPGFMLARVRGGGTVLVPTAKLSQWNPTPQSAQKPIGVVTVGPVQPRPHDTPSRAHTLFGGLVCESGVKSLKLTFEDGRLATLNDLLEMGLRERLRYKALVKRAVNDGLLALGTSRPRPLPIDTLFSLTLTRQVPTKREKVDFDAPAAMFKFVLDALRAQGILADDNPEVVSAPVLEQPIGPYLISLHFRWD